MRLVVLADQAGEIIASQITGGFLPVPTNAVRWHVAVEPEDGQVVHEFDVPDEMLVEGRPVLRNIVYYRIEMVPEPRLVRQNQPGL
jgi:hypothetical protein